MASIAVSELQHADLPEVATLHARAFPESAITAFGPEALRRYYLWLLDGPHDAALTGARLDGRLVGFCAAGSYRGAMNGFLRANRWYLAGHMLRHPRLLASPLVRDRVRSALAITIRFSRAVQRLQPEPDIPRFGVLAIGTDPAVRGSGAGRALMLDAEARARARGHEYMNLVVHTDNQRAVRFYEQLGWVRQPDATGTWAGEMRLDLTKPRVDAARGG